MYRGLGRGAGESVAAETTPADNAERAARRARSIIRRYLVANKLRYMWTLTYATGVYVHADVMSDVARFIERMHATFPQVKAYLFVCEPHPGGHGWHAHLFVGAFLDWERVGRTWGHGYVTVSDWGARSNRGKSLRERIRAGAGYAAKYASKSLEAIAAHGCSCEPGEHRYERSQGHDARVCRCSAVSIMDARVKLAQFTRCGITVERWLSDDPGWRGPPLLWVAWDQ